MTRDRDLEVLAAIVHAVLAVLHFLGFVFGVRRRSPFDATVHGAAVVYDTVATVKHVRAASGESS